jgi:hypothetical protein
LVCACDEDDGFGSHEFEMGARRGLSVRGSRNSRDLLNLIHLEDELFTYFEFRLIL